MSARVPVRPVPVRLDPVRLAGARGLTASGTSAPELELVAGWLASGRPGFPASPAATAALPGRSRPGDPGDPGESVAELKPGRVWRVGSWLVKLHPPRPRWDLRPARALREARRALSIAPIPTPAPRVALVATHGSGPPREPGGESGRSMIVTDWIDGLALGDAWQGDERARRSLPTFIALQHDRGVFHGDPHPANQLWDGERWWLIDLDGLRPPLRRLARRRLAVRHWARLWHNLELGGREPEPEIRHLLRDYAALRGLPPEPFERAVEHELRAGATGKATGRTNS